MENWKLNNRQFIQKKYNIPFGGIYDTFVTWKQGLDPLKNILNNIKQKDMFSTGCPKENISRQFNKKIENS